MKLKRKHTRLYMGSSVKQPNKRLLFYFTCKTLKNFILYVKSIKIDVKIATPKIKKKKIAKEE